LAQLAPKLGPQKKVSTTMIRSAVALGAVALMIGAANGATMCENGFKLFTNTQV
jgi:hypothetical protein